MLLRVKVKEIRMSMSMSIPPLSSLVTRHSSLVTRGGDGLLGVYNRNK